MITEDTPNPTIKEDEILSDKQIAEMVFKDRLKANSYKTIQKLAREGAIKGVLVGKSWRFNREAVHDFLMGIK